MEEKLVKFILGVDLDVICEKVVLAPCWFPDSVGLKSEIISEGTCKIWNCILQDVEFTYIVSGVGAAGCLDIVIALGETKCKDILFIGSAGALKKEINIGDIAIPKSIVCAEGASRYISPNLFLDTYGDKFSVDDRLYNTLASSIAINKSLLNVSVHTGAGISVESISLQFKHLSEFTEIGCDFVDMESSAFLAATKMSNLRGAIAYCISDNVAQGEPLYLVPNEKTSFRKKVRKVVFPAIIACFLDGEKNDI